MRKYLRKVCTIVISAIVSLVSPARAKAEDQEKPRFEVMSLKRVPYDDHYSECDFYPGGRFKAHTALKSLICKAYEIPFLQVVGIPDYLDKPFWDIEAKPEEGKYPLKNGLLDPHIGALMIQSMLEDRFRLKVHQETRILPGYELIIAKGGPKLTPPKDNPMPPPPGGGFLSRTKDPTKPGPRAAMMAGSLWISNISIHHFATNLALTLSIEGDKNRIYVVDKTGLEGSYDIQLTWTPSRGGLPIASQNQSAADSETTIFDAIQDQLGLKLVPAKVWVPVLVVDDAQMPEINQIK